MNFKEAFETVEYCIKKNGVEIDYFALNIVKEHLAKMREFPTDIDGEPLECGDEVIPIDHDNDELQKSIYIGGKYWIAYGCEPFAENTRGYGKPVLYKIDRVRKVKPELENPDIYCPKCGEKIWQGEEQKPVDPIEEVYEKYKNRQTGSNLVSGPLDELWQAIKEHMKAKEGKKELKP